MGPGKRTARPMILPSRRSLSTSAAFASGAFRVTTGRGRPASVSEIDRYVGARVGGEISKRGTRFVRTHCPVRARVEGRLPRLLPRFDREDAGIVRLRDLDGGKADAAGSDDDDDILFLRLPECDNRPVGGGAAASERGGQCQVEFRRQRQNGGLFRDDELRVATRRVEAQRSPVFAEVRPLAAALPAPSARLLEMHSDQVADLRGVYILANFRDSAHDLVTGNEWRVLPGLDLIEEVEVGSADAGSEDLHQDVLGPWLRVRNLDEFDRASRFEPNRTHGEPRSSVPHKTVCLFASVFARIGPRRPGATAIAKYPKYVRARTRGFPWREPKACGLGCVGRRSRSG